MSIQQLQEELGIDRNSRGSAKNGGTGFPAQRLRRLRQNESFRRLVREHSLAVDDLILPLFVVPGHGVKHEINAIPGNYHLSIDKLIEEVKEVRDLGIPGVLLFGVPDASEKDLMASGAYSPTGIVQQAVRALKKEVPEVLVITDVCLCEYTPHCHCGILENGYLVNDASKEVLAKTALSHVEAGSDMVAPAAMLDGQIWLPEVGKSTHYHAYYVHPSWVSEMTKLYKFGVHTFYRPKAWGDGSDAPSWGTPQQTAAISAELAEEAKSEAELNPNSVRR